MRNAHYSYLQVHTKLQARLPTLTQLILRYSSQHVTRYFVVQPHEGQCPTRFNNQSLFFSVCVFRTILTLKSGYLFK
jgi:hypothetical protein